MINWLLVIYMKLYSNCSRIVFNIIAITQIYTHKKNCQRKRIMCGGRAADNRCRQSSMCRRIHFDGQTKKRSKSSGRWLVRRRDVCCAATAVLRRNARADERTQTNTTEENKTGWRDSVRLGRFTLAVSFGSRSGRNRQSGQHW